MLKGFREFIMRGNVVDLAVGVVIGVAFTTLVTSFTTAFLEPLIRLVSGGKELAGVWTIGGQTFDWAGFANGLIGFVITAAVLYFLVVTPINRLNRLRARGEEPEPEAQSDEVRLLTEIRDALVHGRRAEAEVPAPRSE